MTDPPSTEIPLLPVRMVNEWVYCPRLAYLEWVDGEWADTGDTEDGRRTHARVDVAAGRLPPPGEDQAEDTRPFQTRSVTMSSERLGIIAKMDVIEGQGRRVVPVDFKRGKRPHTEHGAYEPERVQVCAQALILEDAGYEVAEGALWFSGSRERVRVELDADLRTRTLDAISGLRNAAQRRERPPPLEDSPKCPRCSLAGICLPDEVNFFKDEKPPRPLNPADDAALPLHVQTPGALVRKKGDRLHVTVGEEANSVRLADISEVNLYGPVSITTPTIAALLRRETPVSWHSTGGWFLGQARSPGRRALDTRRAQFRLADDPGLQYEISAALVAAKIRNQRTHAPPELEGRRGLPSSVGIGCFPDCEASLPGPSVRTEEERLLGREGEAAALYFGQVPNLISTGSESARRLHLGQAFPPSANRPDQRAPVVHLFAGGPYLYRRLGNRRTRSAAGVFPSSPSGAPCPDSRHDGTIPADSVRQHCHHGDQQR